MPLSQSRTRSTTLLLDDQGVHQFELEDLTFKMLMFSLNKAEQKQCSLENSTFLLLDYLVVKGTGEGLIHFLLLDIKWEWKQKTLKIVVQKCILNEFFPDSKIHI